MISRMSGMHADFFSAESLGNDESSEEAVCNSREQKRVERDLKTWSFIRTA